jgi:hypothetical protein
MSLELLGGHETADGIAVTFATEHGIEQLEGTREEVARLAEVMHQVSVFAALDMDETSWLEDVAVGNAVVQFGLRAGGQAKVRILRT